MNESAIERGRARLETGSSIGDPRLLIDHLPVMIAVADPHGRVDYVNPRITDYLGLSVRDVVAQSWISGIHPEDREAVSAEWARCVSSGDTVKLVHRLRGVDGRFRWFRAVVEPLLDDARRIQRWYGVLTEIDEQEKAERAAIDREQNLRAMLDAIPGMVCKCGADGDLEYVNQPMLDLMGHGVEESRRLGWASTIHPEDRDALVQHWQAATQSAQLMEHEYRRLCRDGEYRWFHVRMKPQTDEHGKPQCWYALIVDIDDRIRAEDARRRDENNVWRALESIPIMIWCATADGTISYRNKHLLDYHGAGLQGPENQFRLLHPDDAESAMREWRHSIETGEPFSTIVRMRRADGVYRWLRVAAEALRDEHDGVSQWYGIQVDVHEYRTAQDALQHTQARLTRASQAAAVAELSASIAHEVNQPLSAVVAHGHACQRWLCAEPPNVDRARRTAAKIVENANAAGEVISRIRALFRQTAPVKSTLDLNEVIKEASQLSSQDCVAADVALHLDLDPRLPRIRANKLQLQQVLANLLRNAIDALSTVGERVPTLVIRSRGGPSGGVLVEVCDNGPGVTDLERIFEPFVTTKEKGMGMGLTICRSIIEAHRGRLWAARNVEHGMTFSFELPMQAHQPSI